MTHLLISCDPEEGPWVASPRNGSIFEMLKYSSARQQKEKLWEAWIARSVYYLSLINIHLYLNFSHSIPRIIFSTIRLISKNSVVPSNIEILKRILPINFSEEIANQMKFRSMAHYQLANKMVGNPETLREFIAG